LALRLAIHCGVHKTATTSFQKLCADNRALLRNLGIFYPEFGAEDQHSQLLHDAQRDGINVLGAYLAECRANAALSCHTVLISGEDFENCLVDVALASEVESLASRIGFDSTVWIVVVRPLNEAIVSLYAELSKHGVVLSREIMHRAAEERGCIYVATARFNHIFVLDYARFAVRFRNSVSGRVIEFEHDQFIRDYPGRILLKQLLPDGDVSLFDKSAQITGHRENVKQESMQVEANYLATAIDVGTLRYPVFRPLLWPLIWLRCRKRRRIDRAMQDASA